MNAEKINYVYVGTLFFLLGCYGSLAWWELKNYQLVLGLAVGILLVALFLKRLRKFWSAIIGLMFLLLGMWAGSNAPLNPKEQLQPYFHKEAFVYGSIVPDSVKQYPYGTAFVLRCEELHIKKDAVNLRESVQNKKNLGNLKESFGMEDAYSKTDYKQKLRVFTKNKDLPITGKVWCKGELLPLNTLRNPGTFDGERWNYLQGLGGRLRKAQVEVVSEEGSLLDKLAVFNLYLREKIMSVASGEAGALLCGMLLGGSVGLSDATREAFASNGLAHLLSVSGTHFALLTSFLLLLFKHLLANVRKPLILLLLCAYAVLCGLKPPIMRALCMSLVLLYGGSGAARGNLLCLTGMLLLAFSPAWLLDIGFQLSFGAVAGLIWLYPKLRNYFCEYLPVILGEAVALTMAAQLAVLPFVVAYFHQLPAISMVSNILFVPVLEVATLLTLAGVALDFVVPWGESFIKIAAWLVEQILMQARFLGSLPFATVVVGALPLWCAVVYYFGLGLWSVPCLQFVRNRERRLLLAIAGAVLGAMFLWKQFVPMPMAVYFLDVGQGDCAVVVTRARKVIVIDTGGLKNFDTGSRVLVPFLRSLGKSKVDALLLSHGDYDHAGGAGALARNMQIGQIILPSSNTVPEAEEALLRNAGESLVERASVGRKYAFDEVVLEIVDVPRPENIYDADGNEASTVASIRYGKHSLLFTGDINSGRERLLDNLDKYDVLKVAHHGSKHSSSLKFLQQLQPRLAVISVGANSYGHPHQETLARLESVGSKVLRTDELGAIKVIFDDADIKWYSYVYNSKHF